MRRIKQFKNVLGIEQSRRNKSTTTTTKKDRHKKPQIRLDAKVDVIEFFTGERKWVLHGNWGL